MRAPSNFRLMTTRGRDASRDRRAAFARGVEAEAQAAALLEAQGFSILVRRLRTPRGEIDLIARREALLVFVEVKARGSLDMAAHSLPVRQQRRIAGAAEIFLADNPAYANFDMRLDVILVAPGVPPRHLPGAFEAMG